MIKFRIRQDGNHVFWIDQYMENGGWAPIDDYETYEAAHQYIQRTLAYKREQQAREERAKQTIQTWEF